MCITYRGTNYQYGVRVDIPESPKRLSILLAKDLKDFPYRYAGICLDNGLQVASNKQVEYLAFHDIVNQIIDISFSNEKTHIERFGKPFVPFVNLLEKYPDLCVKFEEGMSMAISSKEIEEFKFDLKPFLERQRYDPENDLKPAGESTVIPLGNKDILSIGRQLVDKWQHKFFTFMSLMNDSTILLIFSELIGDNPNLIVEAGKV